MTDSPYASFSDTLRDNGYHVMPAMPGKKVPGSWAGTEWRPASQWQKWCDLIPPDFLHQRWLSWPDAGICVAHGAIVGLDIDTDRKDVSDAASAAVGPSPVRRTGAKGWMGYYRPGAGLAAHTARVRWYDRDGKICVELLLHGTQSVIPPTIHPDTKKPYKWITPDNFESVSADDLPELPSDAIERLDRAFAALGLTRQAPRKARATEYDRPEPSANDLEKPLGRSINDRAMEPAAIDRWWPALQLPKSRQRGAAGSWEAVPFWRGSGSGRGLADRNPNLKVVPSGIIDFGADRSYTPVDVVMAARDCSFPAAVEWLEQYIRAEEIIDMTGITAPVVADDGPGGAEEKNFSPTIITGRWSATPVFMGTRSVGHVEPVAVPSRAEFDAMLPIDPPPFPIQSFDVLEGLLGEVVSHIDAASVTHTEAGALAVALPLLGAAMGQAYQSPTKLRTNIYTVALGGSGSGKTSLVNPAKDLMMRSGIQDMIGGDRFGSGPGLLQMLTNSPRRVSFLDEFGHMLQQIGSAGAAVHYRQIMTEFTSLYSAANSLFTGTELASRSPTPIDCPHLCLFGMATPDQFWRAFGSAGMDDGSVARYMIMPLGDTSPKVPDDSAAEQVAKSIRDLQQAINSRISGNMGRIEAMTVPMDDYAARACADLKAKETAFAKAAERDDIKGAPSIIKRVTENAIKIALISAVGRNYRNPEIDQRDMDIGHAIAWWSANVMIRNIASHVADNQTERDVNDVERKIKAAGPEGILQGILSDRCRNIKKRDFQEIVERLVDAGRVEKKNTAKSWRLRYIGGTSEDT